eukprot:Clim_evm24s210 gene=Clim_evmTU24s210
MDIRRTGAGDEDDSSDLSDDMPILDRIRSIKALRDAIIREKRQASMGQGTAATDTVVPFRGPRNAISNLPQSVLDGSNTSEDQGDMRTETPGNMPMAVRTPLAKKLVQSGSGVKPRMPAPPTTTGKKLGGVPQVNIKTKTWVPLPVANLVNTEEDHIIVPQASYDIDSLPLDAFGPPTVAKSEPTRSCRLCSRSFALSRVDKHEDACKKSQKRRKAFDATKMRVAGTEAAGFVLNHRGGIKLPKDAPNRRGKIGKKTTKISFAVFVPPSRPLPI